MVAAGLRTKGQSGTLADWGEDIPLILDPLTKDHTMTLPLVEEFHEGRLHLGNRQQGWHGSARVGDRTDHDWDYQALIHPM